MGRATWWLRNLWGSNKENKERKDYSGDRGQERVEKKRWSFRRSRDSGDVALGQNAAAAARIEAAWFKSYYAAGEKEQSKHAIAVAAATAAAADAAVAAARAAVVAMRLSSQGRGAMFSCARARMAAEKIQTAYRGYLARKALRALKALVKLQALVRGYLVRKQAAATLNSMQALVRVQATVRAQRSRNDRSLERFDETRSERMSSFPSWKLSTSLDSATLDRSSKIVEIDTCRPKSRCFRRSSPCASDPADESPLHAFSSPVPCQIPAPISIPRRRHCQENDWSINGENRRCSATAHSTPRYITLSSNEAITPVRSVCGGAEGVFRQYSNVSSSPNYMANTQSSKAKLWSHSAAKPLPDPAGARRQPLSEVNVEAKANSGGVGMQKSCSQVQGGFSFKRAVVGRLDRSSSELGKEAEKEVHLQRRW